MNAKAYLRQAYRLNELINSDLVEVTELRELLTSISGMRFDKDKVQEGNRTGSKIENIISKIVDLENTIDAEIDKYVDLKAEIRTAINQVENQNERLLLRLRYIEFLPWGAIQMRMSLEERQIYVLHERALKNFAVPCSKVQ